MKLASGGVWDAVEPCAVAAHSICSVNFAVDFLSCTYESVIKDAPS